MAERYQSSVEAVDKQLGNLMDLLQKNKLLDNTLIVLLSDHGTALGLPGDRLIKRKNFVGNTRDLSWVPNVSSSTDKYYRDYDISYGQGTDVLSFKQYHVLLAVRSFGIKTKTIPHKVSSPTSLLDISPTILDFLKLPPLAKSDGVSFFPALFSKTMGDASRSLWLETGYKISAIETSNIHAAEVLQKGISIYQINKNGLLFVKPNAEHSIIKEKQRAILMGDWMLAYFPKNTGLRLVHKKNSTEMVFEQYTIPDFFVVANTRSGKWTIGFTSSLAKTAPIMELKKKFYGFYGDEV